MSVVIETTIGDITVDLYLKERPNTCLNFLKLCKMKYYNLCLFYKIEKNFIAQTGDPTATGRGGESLFCHLYGEQAKYFDAEFKPRLKHEKIGTLSMVNNGNNMNGSQFFLTLSENLTYLDENHSVFGEVTEGLDTLKKLNDAICDNNNRPYQDIRITHTVVLHDPYEDPKGLEIPDASPEPTKEMLESNYIGADEEIDDTKGKSTEEIEEKIKESEAKARATILEMVGDIPDADVKPPENVLFVCKLNPVTTSEDLEIIFSRFGKILSCEVIKDRKTGDSLQYAFIEFEREEDCEAAYFKMDNVLIDDRRIHVDFSQSVSKMNFESDKIPNTKQKSNISLKRTDRDDGYSLIFDMDNEAPPRHKDKKPGSNEYQSEKKKPKKDNEDRNCDKKTRDNYHSYEDRYADSYSKSRNRHSEHSSSRKYKDYGHYKKSPERSPKRYRTPERKHRYDSVSPDKQRKSSSKYKEQLYSDFSKKKHSEKYNRHEHSRSKSFKKSEKDKRNLSSHKSKSEISSKAHLPKKSRRHSPVTSSSSSSDSDSSSSSSSSSSDNRHTKKSQHRKQKDKSTSNSQKRKKYS